VRDWTLTSDKQNSYTEKISAWLSNEMIIYGKQIITYDKQVEKSVRRNKKFEWSKFNMDTINSMKQIVGSLKKKNGYMSDRFSY
jgi:hypothetical protein